MSKTDLDERLTQARPRTEWSTSPEGRDTWKRIVTLHAQPGAGRSDQPGAGRGARPRTRQLLAAACVLGVIGAGAVTVQMTDLLGSSPAPVEGGLAYDVRDLHTVMTQTSHVFVGEVTGVTGDNATDSTTYAVRVTRRVLGADVADRVVVQTGPESAALQPGRAYIFAANLGSGGVYLCAPGPYGARAIADQQEESTLVDQYSAAD